VADPSVHHRTCPLCEATCGLAVHLDDDRSVRIIRGDRDDVLSHGFLCPKGAVLHRVHDDPDRLRLPLVRRGTTFDEVDWPEAFATIAERLLPIAEAHGRDALGIYLGNPNAHGHHNVLLGRPLIKALGTRNVFSASTVDQMPKHVASGLMFGNQLTIPVPDLDRTQHLVLLGANPHESNGSLCTAPDFPGRLAAIRARGGKVVVIDPRRTATATHADEHHAIRPGTDALLLVAMAQVLDAEHLVDPGSIEVHLRGLDAALGAVRPFTPEVVAPATGIDPDTIRRLAQELAAAPSAAVYGRIGTHTTEFGTLAAWAVDLLNVLTGNLDRPGGAMWPSPAHLKARSRPGGRGYLTGRWASRVSARPEANGELPVACLAEEILAPGPGQLRALFTVGGNPARSTPQSEQLERALGSLDLMVSVDPALNETTRHAHVILPPPGPLARSHYDLAFYALSVRNVANWSPPLYDPQGPEETEILARLALIAMGMGADADPTVVYDLVLDTLLRDAVGKGGPEMEGRDPADLRAQLWATHPADRALEVLLRSGQHGDRFGAVHDGLTLEHLARHPHGIDLGPLVPQLPDILSTPSGAVELAPEPILADLDRLLGAAARERPRLVLVGRRDLRSNNSWMHNVEVLVKGRLRCTLQVHPEDAERLGLTDGSTAEVRSRVGQVVAPVEISDSMAAGVVSLPHGWGHDASGTRMKVASQHPGVNVNVLTDAGTLDPLSGNAVLTAVPVEVTPVGLPGSAEPPADEPSR
jgi:anaerobic selenocysteine-containing dehydrogenase